MAAHNRLYYFFRNLDRAAASLIWGTADDTISGLVNQPDDPAGRALKDALNTVIPGHTERAQNVEDQITQADPEAK